MESSDRSPSPSHSHSRKRIFDEKTREACWKKADVIPGRHPDRWRMDAAGNAVCRRFHGCRGCLCYQFDHIVPFSKGGETTVENCQILQSRVNGYKSNQEDINSDLLHQFSCDLKFGDKELDIIEMAVYGNVVRPGLQCRCKSVGETLGLSVGKSSKYPEMACELPYKSSESADPAKP